MQIRIYRSHSIIKNFFVKIERHIHGFPVGITFYEGNSGQVYIDAQNSDFLKILFIGDTFFPDTLYSLSLNHQQTYCAF